MVSGSGDGLSFLWQRRCRPVEQWTLLGRRRHHSRSSCDASVWRAIAACSPPATEASVECGNAIAQDAGRGGFRRRLRRGRQDVQLFIDCFSSADQPISEAATRRTSIRTATSMSPISASFAMSGGNIQSDANCAVRRLLTRAFSGSLLRWMSWRGMNKNLGPRLLQRTGRRDLDLGERPERSALRPDELAAEPRAGRRPAIVGAPAITVASADSPANPRGSFIDTMKILCC